MTIPASQIVAVNPGVISAGGNSLALNGLFLTQNALMPALRVLSFSNSTAVSSFFGVASTEAALASIYFAGYDNSTIKPGAMLFAPFNLTARAGYLQGGNISALTLTALQALSGSLTIVFDGYTRTDASLNLSTATSYSDAAAKITTAINTSLPAEATTDTGTISTTTMTVAGVVTGVFSPGQTVVGSTVTANSIILSQLTSTETDSHMGGKGTYKLSQSSTVGTAEVLTADATAVVVTWSSTLNAFVVTSGITGVASGAAFATGTLAASLGLTSATGAIISNGDTADTPGSAMGKAVAFTQNFASIVTLWEPVLADKTNFAVWNQGQNSGQDYAYLGWDTDNQALIQGATEPFGVLVKAANYNGVMCISGDPNVASFNNVTLASALLNTATFVAGAIASINFSQTNGRITIAFKSQSGLLATVRNGQLAQNLLANGYNFYGAYATANQGFTFLYNGQISGEWKWLDPFVDQIYLNSQFQLALMTLLTQIGSIPYNEQGYGMVRAALLDPIQAALNFGAIRSGVVLSAAEQSEVNTAAGLNVASIIQTQGYYLQILDPGATARGLRQTPIVNFYYTDGGAIQQITLASIDMQ